jgi:hypothetical protein
MGRGQAQAEANKNKWEEAERALEALSLALKEAKDARKVSPDPKP